jgi:hypothetical protein
MPCPYPLRTHRSVCTIGLAHPRGRWAAGKIPAPQHNQGGSRTRPYLDQHHSRFAIRYSQFFAIRHSLALRSNRQRRNAAPLPIRAGCGEGGSRTRPYLDQYHSPFTIRYSLFAIRRLSPLAARCGAA